MSVDTPSEQRDPRRGLRAWFRHATGRALLEDERAWLDHVLPDLFGYYLLQVGRVTEQDVLGASRTLQTFVMDIERESPRRRGDAALRGRPEALPFALEALDVVVLQHVLEFAEDPHQVLRDVERCLIADGRVVVFGFNPWSPWLLWRWLLRRWRRPPWSAHFHGLTRIRDWLALLGFDIEVRRTFHFRLPGGRRGPVRGLEDRAGGVVERFLPFLGRAWIIVARKRVVTLTPVRPRWRRRPRFLGSGMASGVRGTGYSGYNRCHTRRGADE